MVRKALVVLRAVILLLHGPQLLHYGVAIRGQELIERETVVQSRIILKCFRYILMVFAVLVFQRNLILLLLLVFHILKQLRDLGNVELGLVLRAYLRSGRYYSWNVRWRKSVFCVYQLLEVFRTPRGDAGGLLRLAFVYEDYGLGDFGFLRGLRFLLSWCQRSSHEAVVLEETRLDIQGIKEGWRRSHPLNYWGGYFLSGLWRLLAYLLPLHHLLHVAKVLRA